MSATLAFVMWHTLGFMVAGPCASEDAIPSERACYWDADVRGNGIGDSFIHSPMA